MDVDRKIVGIFRTIDDAAFVINELKDKGYSAGNISAIGGAGIGGGAGSLIGAFIGLGIPEEHAKKYEEYIYDGNILILVDAKLDDKLEIYKIFDKHNAYNSDFFK
ncbi:hypothetical protein BGP34_04525 [Bacillus mycoides]|uniref:hypothetical protein n=1 Tax=Bacillus mycoides TaxID=1405 RepID=UPI0009922981|nr:hypothetical protein [Bacillus mycoides]OOR60073.1 hypothetical protein BGP34_04525 [Bacillus mycoides]